MTEFQEQKEKVKESLNQERQMRADLLRENVQQANQRSRVRVLFLVVAERAETSRNGTKSETDLKLKSQRATNSKFVSPHFPWHLLIA